MDYHRPPSYAGRAASGPLANRFERVHLVSEREQLPVEGPLTDDSTRAAPGDPSGGDSLIVQTKIPTQWFPDASRTIIRENNSPDIPFRYSINPYRGCEHGCAYCYARPTHETLGLDAAIDFETKILVKHDAARLLREELARPRWSGEPIVMSGVTDCYQPAERRYQITRSCLQVMLDARQAVAIVTKNALVLRDLDVLRPLAERNLVRVMVSITTLRAELARRMEPRTATPAARLRTLGELSAAGVPCGVMVAPVIPGLNDQEMPAILREARQAGALTAAYQLLRLPLSVKPVFFDWLSRELPEHRDRIESRIRSTRAGKTNDAEFGRRMRGSGAYAEEIARLFQVFRQQCGLDGPLPPLDTSQFRPPRSASGQLRLF